MNGKIKLSTLAPAKINLFLEITGRRDDGYHDLTSIMQSVSLADRVTLTLSDTGTEENKISITCSDKAIPTDSGNIAAKCALAYFGFYGIRGRLAEIDIVKNIPSSGGLAGGSSDGAAVLRLLDDVFGRAASYSELLKLGGSVGADIPFCLTGGCALCRGIGDKVESLTVPERDYGIIILSSGESVSTPSAYALCDEVSADNSSPRGAYAALTDELTSGRLPRSLFNSFERVILPLRPGADELKKRVLSLGAYSAMMSGSGPSVFGIFDERDTLEAAYRALTESGAKAYKCSPVYDKPNITYIK